VSNPAPPLPAPHIVIAGAGSIGCFIGGLLAVAGHHVTLLARPRIVADIQTHGLTLTDFSGLNQRVAPNQLSLTTTPDCLKTADLILVTVKTGATAEIARQIAHHAPAQTPIISLQNGLHACETLRAALPSRDIRAAMVPFNVVPQGQGAYHRATSGNIILQSGPQNLATQLTTPNLAISETDDITATQWGKLLLNLGNALNALSGQTLQQQLLDRDWRHLIADQMAEALTVLKTAQIPIKSTTPLPAWMGPHILRLPTPLFRKIAAQMLTIDPTARTSMAYDLMANRPTEIDSLQGAIIALGQTHAIPTPICTRVAHAIRTAEAAADGQPNLSPAGLRP
jgi:2-dehydropantoate 2-reductase